MTRNYDEILKYRASIKEKNIQNVYKTLKEGNLTTREIKERIDAEYNLKATKKYTKQYNKGEITSSERDGLIQEHSIGPDIRTIQRALKFLIGRGLIEKKNNRYRFTHKGADVKFLPESFGRSLFSLMSKGIYPSIQILEQNLKNLIECFGVYVLLCLLEGARPPMNKKLFDLQERDDLVYSWINNVLDAEGMYTTLLVTMEHQHTDEEINNLIENNFKSIGGRPCFVDDKGNEIIPLSAFDFSLERFEFATHTISDPKITGKPTFEADEQKIALIQNYLKDKHQDLFESFLRVRQEHWAI